MAQNGYSMMKLDEQTEEVIHSYKDTPWCSNPKAYQNIVHEDENVIVFKDRYPVTEGHLLFVPKKRERRADITNCFTYAYEWGVTAVCNHEYEAFNVGINNGVAAGQSVMWPHVHLIPRRKGDTPNPRGGVRHVIPCKGDYGEGATRMPMAAPVVLEDEAKYKEHREWKKKIPITTLHNFEVSYYDL